ncbi:MAG TPA: DUF4199 domain-containing protein [Chryseosolibacter sp.]
MKKIVLVYGSIAGLIVSSMFVITHSSGKIDFDNGMFVGYASMVIAFSLIFFGVKNYRDNHLAGAITFGRAFKVGLLVTLVASVIYAVAWEFYFNLVVPDFMVEYTGHIIKKMETEGASAEEIAEARAQMKSTSELYKNPLFRFLMTLLEIVPVGFVISLICAALLRKTEFLPKNIDA